MVERWLPVVGYEGLYEVSDTGKVRSLAIGREMRQTIRGKAGIVWRANVGLSRDGARNTFAVHRLVLDAFVGPCPAGMECRHLNGNASDNRLENIAWGTRSENAHDRVRHGTQKTGQEHPRSKLTDDEVRRMRQMHADGVGVKRLVASFGVCRRTVQLILRRVWWRHLSDDLAAAPARRLVEWHCRCESAEYRKAHGGTFICEACGRSVKAEDYEDAAPARREKT